MGRVGSLLRVRIAAPAVEGKANAELKEVLAGYFGVRPRDVIIVRGKKGREKDVRIIRK